MRRRVGASAARWFAPCGCAACRPPAPPSGQEAFEPSGTTDIHREWHGAGVNATDPAAPSPPARAPQRFPGDPLLLVDVAEVHGVVEDHEAVSSGGPAGRPALLPVGDRGVARGELGSGEGDVA